MVLCGKTFVQVLIKLMIISSALRGSGTKICDFLMGDDCKYVT